MERLHTLHVDAELDLAADPEDERVSTFLFRSVQEMLFNVVKHAGVKKAKLQLTLEGRSVTVRVIDQGRGIEAGALSGPAMGLSMFDDEQTAQKMIKAGAYAYLSKVGESSKLLAVMRESCRVNAR